MRVLISGGGTGGHIYPAVSIVQRLQERKPGVQVLYVGTGQGLEADLVPRAGIPFQKIRVQGLVGKSWAAKLQGLVILAGASWEALRVVRRFKPDVVVGTGGYVSGPVLAAALLLRIPSLIQEQNAVPGVTNRLLGPLVGGVAAAYADSRHYFSRRARLRITGNPVRPEILGADREEARQALGLNPADRLVVAFFGSRGSLTVNRSVVEMLTAHPRPGYRLIYITGDAHHEEVRRRLAGVPLGSGVDIRSYAHDMPRLLAASDLVLGRAGALALSEITALGVPAVLIPSPYVTHHHQERNAEAVARAGGAVILPERELNGEVLAETIEELLGDEERRRAMATASRSLGRPAALDEIVDWILELARPLVQL